MKTINAELLRYALRSDRAAVAPRKPGMLTCAVVSDLGGSHLTFTSTVADRTNRCALLPAYNNGSRWTNGH